MWRGDRWSWVIRYSVSTVPSLSLPSGFDLEFERSSLVFRCLLIVHLQIVVDRHILKRFATANMDVLLGFPVLGPSYQPRCCFFGSSVKKHVVVRIQNSVEIQFSPPFIFFLWEMTRRQVDINSDSWCPYLSLPSQVRPRFVHSNQMVVSRSRSPFVALFPRQDMRSYPTDSLPLPLGRKDNTVAIRPPSGTC